MHLPRQGLSPLLHSVPLLVRNASAAGNSLRITLGTLVSGQVLVEYIFAYTGLGNVIFSAIPQPGLPVIQGASLRYRHDGAAELIIDLIYLRSTRDHLRKGLAMQRQTQARRSACRCAQAKNHGAFNRWTPWLNTKLMSA